MEREWNSTPRLSFTHPEGPLGTLEVLPCRVKQDYEKHLMVLTHDGQCSAWVGLREGLVMREGRRLPSNSLGASSPSIVSTLTLTWEPLLRVSFGFMSSGKH